MVWHFIVALLHIYTTAVETVMEIILKLYCNYKIVTKWEIAMVNTDLKKQFILNFP